MTECFRIFRVILYVLLAFGSIQFILNKTVIHCFLLLLLLLLLTEIVPSVRPLIDTNIVNIVVTINEKCSKHSIQLKEVCIQTECGSDY